MTFENESFAPVTMHTLVHFRYFRMVVFALVLIAFRYLFVHLHKSNIILKLFFSRRINSMMNGGRYYTNTDIEMFQNKMLLGNMSWGGRGVVGIKIHRFSSQY